MDGLECSEVWLSYIKKSNDIFRLDSFFFAKEFLDNENLIGKITAKSIQEIGGELRSFGAYSLNNEVDYLSEGIPFIRGINMKNGTINFDNLLYISDRANKLLWKSEVKPHTILLSMSGTIGEVAIAQANWNYPINSNQDIAKISFTKNIDPYFVFTFMLTKYGQSYLRREARGSVQQHVFLSQIEQFKIPLFSDTFQNSIRKIIHQTHDLSNNGRTLYLQAETLLLDEFGMTNFIPSTEKATVKSFSDSFGVSGRLDAEYYQTKYEQIEKALFKPQYVEQCCKLFDTNYTPSEKMKYKYIELSNIGTRGDISNVDTIIGIELPSRARRQVKVGQVIISSIEGSLNSCAIVTKEYHNALCSTGFYVIESDSINSETLLILFKSSPIQSLMKKRCSGTILTAISKDEFLHLPLPTISLKTQNEIAVKVQESFLLRKKSKELLERAIQAVEMAIEKDEETAMDWLNSLK